MISVRNYKADSRAELKVLALNSGSSSLKFGLYRVGPLRADMHISGEAEDRGDAKGRFHARDSQSNTLLSQAISIPGQRHAVVRIV
jgi:acetate kinase